VGVLVAEVVGRDVVEAHGAVPRTHQQELVGVGAEFH
jgi:hypothetical protein